jgi:predicted O-linked N-acetylglucosamine transferase (SPINDLY family)
MDYRITDNIADSKKSEKYYREKLIYLPKSFLNYTPAIGVDIATIPENTPFDRNGYITFGCFNRFNKINDLVISVWERILLGANESRLIVKTKEFLTPKLKQKFLDSFKDKSVLERVEIIDYSDTYVDHLPDYNLMDVSLDTFPYSGTTTSCESLYMGVPVLTIFDKEKYLHSQNVTSSLMINSDLKEYVTYSIDEYVDKAIDLSKSFSESKQGIRDKFLNGNVCDYPAFIDDFENTLIETYLKHKWTELRHV